jgi:hypothetical protein
MMAHAAVPPLERSPLEEVVRLHTVIEAWLAGRDGTDFAGFAGALAAGFSMVSPDGSAVDRAAVVEGFHQAFGAVPDIRIEIRNAAVVDAGEGLAGRR